jgi:hypothetical protein
MANIWRGLYRDDDGYAYVTDDTVAMPLPQAEYRERGYLPDYGSLPTEQQYAAAEASKKAAKEQP